MKPEQFKCIMKIRDYRDDPEGIIFNNPSHEKAMTVDEERRRHYPARYELFEQLDHSNESYSIHIKHPEKYKDGPSAFCHSPDIQPTSQPHD